MVRLSGFTARINGAHGFALACTRGLHGRLPGPSSVAGIRY
jgi:hypothetical protein